MRFARRGLRIFGGVVPAALCAACWIATEVAPVAASDNHGAELRTITVAPRTEMRIGNQEVVISYAGGALLLFLHRYVDGVPTSDAEIELTVDFLPNTLSEIAPGIYRSELLTLAAGRNEIEMAYVIGEQSGSEVIPLVIAGSKSPTVQSLPKAIASKVPGSVLAGIALILFVGVNFLLIRRSQSALRTTSGGKVVGAYLSSQ